MDISHLPLADLQHLLAILPEEIENRRAEERKRVIEELAALARARGFELEDLMRKPEAKTEAVNASMVIRRQRASVKYRHPLKCDLAWSGRGRQPKWVAAWLADGRTMAELGA